MRQTDIHIDTDRHPNRQRGSHTYRETDIHINIEDALRKRATYIQTTRHTYIQTYIKTE